MMTNSNVRLIKEAVRSDTKIDLSEVAHLKAKSQTFQVDADLASVNKLLSLIHRARRSGKITINLWLGGINGVEFEETEKVKS